MPRRRVVSRKASTTPWTGSCARSARVPGGRSTTPYGEHTFLDRWNRERKRNKKIRNLKVGSKLTVERSGKTYSCLVKEGHYLYQGNKQFPTLYKLTEHITGKGSSWSGPKFWKLT